MLPLQRQLVQAKPLAAPAASGAGAGGHLQTLPGKICPYGPYSLGAFVLLLLTQAPEIFLLPRNSICVLHP